MRRGRWCGRFALLVVGLLVQAVLSAGPALGAEVRFFTMSRREAFLEGDLDGVSVDSLGVLGLAHRVARVGAVEEPYLFSAARHPDGWVLGTGNAGRVVLLTESGEVSTLLEAEEPTVFAVAVGRGGTVWAASSPGGRVYRIDGGEARLAYDSAETYVWALAPDGQGGVWIGTGTDGRVHYLDAAGRGEVIYDVDDVHVRSLLPLSGGRVLLGTAGEGLLLLLDADGTARTLYDSALAEIVALERGVEGICYAAAIRSEAGLADLTAQAQAQMQPRTQAHGETQASGTEAGAVTVIEPGSPAEAVSSGANGFRSRILRFPCSGGVMETLRGFDDATVYDLMWQDGRLWIATGQEGKVFSLEDGNAVLEQDVDERQVVALLPDRHGPALATTNAAAVYRVLAETEEHGVYTSAALDAGEIAEFGTLHWRGRAAGGAAVRFSVRSGMSASPDRTWSDWSEPRGGAEIAVGDVPPGRYLQFRLELARSVPPPAVAEVSISYRQKNLAPRIESLEVLESGQVLVPANFNPASQVFEPMRPNRDGIFTTLSPERERDNSRLKALWKRGYRTFRWTGEDPNGDELNYRVEFRPEGESERWYSIVDEYEETYLSFDATVLPDGVYRFRVTASDERGNGGSEVLRASRVTAPVTIDHTPPVLGKVARSAGRIGFEVKDALNPLRQAEYSLDGEEWLEVVPRDGLLDGRAEQFDLETGPEVSLVLFRAMDSSFNLVTFDLSPSR